MVNLTNDTKVAELETSNLSISRQVQEKSQQLAAARKEKDFYQKKCKRLQKATHTLLNEQKASAEKEPDGHAAEQEHTLHFRRTGSRGNPYPKELEQHARCVMATGVSAEAAEQIIHLNACFNFGKEKAATLDFPATTWFQRQREALGTESWLYAMIQIAGADMVLQHGCDETKIDGKSTFNQWALISDIKGEPKVVSLEVGGVLIDGTAEGIALHVKKTWARGQQAILILREKLGDLGDELVPLRRGGIELLKLGATMHDTCATANAVPPHTRNVKRREWEVPLWRGGLGSAK